MSEEKEIKSDSRISICCIGMAGSGKSTFAKMLRSEMNRRFNGDVSLYNMDPAIDSDLKTTEFDRDIRTDIDYQEIMDKYQLGPNGAIITALNIYSTHREMYSPLGPFNIYDTPGQIESFAWSASGEFIIKNLKQSSRVVISYIIDAEKAAKPAVFVSSLLYACSIFIRMKCDFVIVINKIDKANQPIAKWIENPEEFHQCLSDSDAESYLTPLLSSMTDVLEFIFSNMTVFSVCSITGLNMDAFIEHIASLRN